MQTPVAAAPRTLDARDFALVARCARQVYSSRQLPPHLDVRDLEQEGAVGLLHAARRWDSTRGTHWENYAERRVLGAILDHLRATDPLSRRDRQRVKRGERQSIRLESTSDATTELAALSTPEQITEQVAVSEVRDWIGRLPEREAMVLRMYYFEGRRQCEIADVLHVNESRASQIKHNGIRRLRTVLGVN